MSLVVQKFGHEADPAKRIRVHQGQKIREARSTRGLTLRALAESMGTQPGITITPAAISEWERGVSTPRRHLQVALSKALDVPWSFLFSLDEVA